MAALDAGTSHPLTDHEIDEQVTRTAPGSYTLGYLDGESFVAFYVGRSDSDVNHRLHAWVGVDSRSTRYAPSGRAAYGHRSRQRNLLPLGSPALCTVGIAVDAGYTHFKFSYAKSAEAAFLTECECYHEFGGNRGLDNERHPVPPEGASCECLKHGRQVGSVRRRPSQEP